MSKSHLMRNLSISDGQDSSSSSSSSNPPSPRQPPVRKTRPTSSKQVDSLYMLVAGGKVSLQQLVADWLEEYKDDMDSAMVRLVQLFISTTGCSGQVTLEMIQTTEQGVMINRLSEQFDKETPGVAGTYPVAGHGALAKKLRGNLTEFVLHLVKQTQNSILYDQFLMDNLVSFLTQLSDSQVRAFRHTATLSTMSFMTGLVRVVVTLTKLQRNVSTQMDREDNKTTDQDVSRIELLRTKLEEIAENLEETQNMLAYMFKSVFVHRYRDVVPEIRSLCLTELGVWLMECPMVFLEDSYLKYLGWSLHDKVGCVRLASIKSLQQLYNCREMIDKLVLLTDKFKERLVSLILDKDIEVSVCAIQLLECLVKYQNNSMTDLDCEKVYELVYSSHRAVARAAGSFLQQKLFSSRMVEQQVRTKRGKMRMPNTSRIRDLIQFFIESEKDDYEAYLVDSLIDNPIVNDWECMTDLLVEESGPEEEELDNIQETALIVLMVASIKQLVTGEHPYGRGPASGRRVQSGKEIRQMASEKELMTTHFMATLPHLIHKYLPDHDKVSKLLAIPQLMTLEMFTTSRQERALDGLLKLLQEVVEKHVEENVLVAAFKTMLLLCSPESSSYTKCHTKREQVVEVLVGKFQESLKEYNSSMTGDMEPGQDELFNLVISIRRISLLSNFHDLNLAEVWEALLEIVRRAEDCFRQDVVGWEPEEAVRSALLGCYYGLSWDMSSGRVGGLLQKVDSFIMICRGLVVHAKATKLAEEAFISICDILVVYKNVRSKEMVAEELVGYLKGQIFLSKERNTMEVQEDDEGKLEIIVRKRNILTCYCKLLVMKLLPAKYFTSVLSHYLSFFSQFGDIIKAAFGELRDSSRTVCARVILMCLVENMAKVEWDITEEKELARRLSLLLGLDGMRNREAVAFIHKEGINVALGQGREMVRLLVVLCEFSGKLLKQDRQEVVGYFNKMVNRCNGEELEEVVIYRNSLQVVQQEVAVGQD